jgi:hypothetical protein
MLCWLRVKRAYLSAIVEINGVTKESCWVDPTEAKNTKGKKICFKKSFGFFPTEKNR